MDTETTAHAVEEPGRRPRLLRALSPGERSGQAIVEFALVSLAFFMITLGTLDIGRAMYQYHELTNAVREGARFGKMEPPNETEIKQTVIDSGPTLRLTPADITRSCTGGCYQGCSDVTVAATVKFRPLLTTLLGLDWLQQDVGEDGNSSFYFELSSSATVEAE